MPLEYMVPSLSIVVITKMTYVGVVEEILSQLVQLKEDRFVIGYYKHVEKEQQKAWHDHHIKFKQFQIGYLVLLYDGKLLKNLGKFQTHSIGPCVVIHITEGGAIQLQKLDGTPFKGLVNGIWLKPYQDSHTSLN